MVHDKKSVLWLLMAYSLSSPSWAAKPVSVTFKAMLQTVGGDSYLRYEVQCSNGEKVDIAAIDNRRRWCLGTDIASPAHCSRKQIQAAKKACR